MRRKLFPLFLQVHFIRIVLERKKIETLFFSPSLDVLMSVEEGNNQSSHSAASEGGHAGKVPAPSLEVPMAWLDGGLIWWVALGWSQVGFKVISNPTFL